MLPQDFDATFEGFDFNSDTELVHNPRPDAPYTHSDFLRNAASDNESKNILLSIANIARVTGSRSRESIIAGFALGRATSFERNSRIAHQRRLRLSLEQIGINYPVLTSRDEIAQDSLVIFAHKVGRFIGRPRALLWSSPNLTGKGYASELGQVEQCGLWQGVEVLDTAIEQLGDSEVLGQLGLEVTKKYDYNGEGKIDYAYRVIDFGTGSIAVERKKPIFDLNDGALQVVKSSLFSLNSKRISQSQYLGITDVILDEDSRRTKVKRMRLGEQLVEPLIADPSLRGKDFRLFPASALHYVLARPPAE